MNIDNAKAEEAYTMILELMEEAEIDPAEAMAACADVITTLADHTETDRDTALDTVLRRIE